MMIWYLGGNKYTKEATSDVETKASVGSLVHEFGTIAGHIGPTVLSSLSCTGLIPSRSKPTIALSRSMLAKIDFYPTLPLDLYIAQGCSS